MQSQDNQCIQVKYIDLFCGMGSFQKLGFKCVMASDIYKPAKENLKIFELGRCKCPKV